MDNAGSNVIGIVEVASTGGRAVEFFNSHHRTPWQTLTSPYKSIIILLPAATPLWQFVIKESDITAVRDQTKVTKEN